MAVYSNILTATDVSARLEIGSSSFDNFFPAFGDGQSRQNVVVEDENEAQWTFVLCIRQTGNYAKPYISQGSWLPFVVRKGAEVDDKVEFSRETDGANGSAFRYKIRLIKKVMKDKMTKEKKEVMKNEMTNEKKEENERTRVCCNGYDVATVDFVKKII